VPVPTTYTKPLTREQATKLRGILLAQGFELVVKPYCLYTAAKSGVSIAVYEKGPKIVVQGKGMADFVMQTLEPRVLGAAELGQEEALNPEMFTPHFGIDESGKGDYFGPLVIAGVYVDAAIARQLQAIGVMDSKRISSDARIHKLAGDLLRIPGLVSEVIVISPQRYNELHPKFGNLNRLLAWGHARVIENLLARRPDCPRALSDQFANPAVLQRALGEKGRSIQLDQRTKAESDPAVAAASILARARFVGWLDALGKRLGETIHKGASALVKTQAKQLIVNHGESILGEIAKLHFKTSAEVLNRINSDDTEL
jgi:ribonuclease HIII